MSRRQLVLPNGHRTNSDRIREVRVFIDQSPSGLVPFVEVVEDSGVVYTGLIGLDHLMPVPEDAGLPGQK